MSSSDDRDDELLRRALQSLPVPETPEIESRVYARLGERRMRRIGAVATGLSLALVALFVWRPWVAEQGKPDSLPVAQVPRDIADDDLDVLFAPPPVDSLVVLDRRDTVSVAALNRLEGIK